MDEQIIEDYRIISTKQLAWAIKEGINSSERFCFILGSGASVSSGIPMGGELERKWMMEIEEDIGLAEVSAIAEKLQKGKYLENDFKEIEEVWQETKGLGTPLPSKYYFDIYKLRFFPNHRNGYHYLEKLIADAKPSFGYHPLVLMLTDKGRNNLVITTNFDSLVEDALFMYTTSKPLVINHELLADYAGDPNISRPIIAKVHRGIFFDPFNMPEETDSLKEKWQNVLATVFQSYTPIVIGYGGGDNSLMEFLADENVKMKNGIYWCYMEEYGLPNEKIQSLVQQKNGFLVRTAGFDAVMYVIGNALFPDNVEPHETGKYLEVRMKMQTENYEKEYKKLTEREGKNNIMGTKRSSNQSEDELREEIEKTMDRLTLSEKERLIANQMTAWDYWRQGNRYYRSKDYGSAVESYSNAIDMQSDIAIFYNNRGTAYADMGENEKALSDFNKAIELKPDYAEAFSNRGYTYDNMSKYERALSDYSKAIELKPDYANPYRHSGTVWKKRKNLEKALSFFTAAIELNSKYKEAYLDRAEVYRLMGEIEKAIADEQIAAKL